MIHFIRFFDYFDKSFTKTHFPKYYVKKYSSCFYYLDLILSKIHHFSLFACYSINLALNLLILEDFLETVLALINLF